MTEATRAAIGKVSEEWQADRAKVVIGVRKRERAEAATFPAWP